MQLGMIGLGRMGSNMSRRLMRDGHDLVVYDLDPENVETLDKEGATGAATLEDLLDKLSSPRVVWVMVPAGDPTEQTVRELGQQMQKGDVVIDGGNTFFKDDVRRARELADEGLHYVDVGTSGGVWGLERGYCLMIGGEKEIVERLDPIFKSLAPGHGEIERTPGRAKAAPSTSEEGYLHCGPAGAGHFVKMVHNGIEYGVMQAYAEGFDVLKSAAERGPEHARFHLELGEIAEVWRRGSVIGSWLLDLTAAALVEDPQLDDYAGFVSDSGEGRWTVQTAIEQATPVEVISSALYTRFRSRQESTFAEKVLSAMRHQFGGHVEK